MRKRPWIPVLLALTALAPSAAKSSPVGFPLASSTEPPATFKRIVICLDGTWNNPYMVKKRLGEEDVMKPTNVLKTCRAVLPVAEDGVRQIVYYDIGVGGLHKYPGAYNRLAKTADSVLGGAWGAGFEARLENAYRFLALNYEPGDQVFLFGFSRGAAGARALARFIHWMRETAESEPAATGAVPPKGYEYWTPHLFKAYVKHKAGKSSAAVVDDLRRGIVERETARGKSKEVAEAEAREQLGDFLPVEVRFLGVWETVLALGSRLKANNRSRDYFLGETPPASVEIARQALAIDERRFDFSPWIWSSSGTSDLQQRWFAGVHSNIGGGYADDSLANVPLAWMVHEADAAGLGLDWEFLSHYVVSPVGPGHDSRKWFYKLKETVTFRRRAGVRSLGLKGKLSLDLANLSLDCSVLKRLQSKKPQPRYGPGTRSLVRYLKGCSKHDAWLAASPLKDVARAGGSAETCLDVVPHFTLPAAGPREQTCVAKTASGSAGPEAAPGGG